MNKQTNEYKCLNCDKLCLWGKSKENKYCGVVCQSEYRWKTVKVPEIESGICSWPVTLKKYLYKTKGAVCSECKISDTWNGKSLTLQLDHIDGNSDNNYPSNIRLLCPNCHSQTITFAGSMKVKKQTKRNSYLRKFKGYD